MTAFAPAWPARPATTPSPWTRAAFRPALGLSARPTPPALRPERRPAPVAAAPRADAGGGFLFGVAVLFDTKFRPRCEQRPGTTFTLEPGCFDAFLGRVARGDDEVRLWVDHDSDVPLCSSADGSLTLHADRLELTFAVRPVSPAGRRAIDMAKTFFSRREASVGIASTDGVLTADGLHIVTTATLAEISLVRRGACRGTWVGVV